MILANLAIVLQKSMIFLNRWLLLRYLFVTLLLAYSSLAFSQGDGPFINGSGTIDLQPSCNIDTITVNIGNHFVSGWENIRGDNDIDTDGGGGFFPSEFSGDAVSVIINTKLVRRGNQIILIVTYHIRETEGDRTEFKSTKEFIVFDADLENKSLIDFRGIGGNIQDFSTTSYGRKHTFQSYDLNGSIFWDKLEYRVDSEYDDDSDFIGIKGIVRFEVELADIISDELAECRERIARLEAENSMIYLAAILKDSKYPRFLNPKAKEVLEGIYREQNQLKGCIEECLSGFGSGDLFWNCLIETGCSDRNTRFKTIVELLRKFR